MSEYGQALFQVLDLQLNQLDRDLNRTEAYAHWLGQTPVGVEVRD